MQTWRCSRAPYNGLFVVGVIDISPSSACSAFQTAA